ncbi:MAG: glucose-6-phosphate 1-dehydrogenase [Lysobacteraceae bacterium]|nr:MAG: glucose-6-phosphate 1-dehydrogenase [Xanthomonadaceae bacterium]
MAQFVPAEPFDLVIFGATGDLAARKLLPALFHRFCDGQIVAGSRIIAAARQEYSSAQFRTYVIESLLRTLDAETTDTTQQHDFCALIEYVSLDFTDANGWSALRGQLSDDNGRIRVLYLATHPKLYCDIAGGAGHNNIVNQHTRIVLEKPIGTDLESARAINAGVGQVFAESQIFRIDHYLGKETVQNLLALRFANALFDPLWNRTAIDHVQITVAEKLGVGNRGAFYDQTGALRDMVQNHLLQLLCLVAMEPPARLDPEQIHNEKTKVLRALRPIQGAAVLTSTVRGQYRAGAIDGTAVDGYQTELGGDSDTESFVALRADIDNWRWADTPFYLRTGKRLQTKTSEVVIVFRNAPHSIFPPDAGTIQPNRLTIRLQPNEGITLSIMTKEPGPGGFFLRALPLDLSFAEAFDANYPDAYERLLMEAIRGQTALFMRRDEVEAAWHWVDDIIAGWDKHHAPCQSYVAGSWGPPGADELIGKDHRSWHCEPCA